MLQLNKLYCEDCLEGMKRIPDGSIDLVITSPPYNIGKPYESIQNINDYLSKYEDIIKEINRILSEKGSVCWQVGNYVNKGEIYPLDILFYPLFKKHGLYLRNRIIWRFGHGLHAKKKIFRKIRNHIMVYKIK